MRGKYGKNKRTRTVTWKCEDGCKAFNIRIIDVDRIINDDICDSCGKVYHEPFTVDVKEE